MARLTPDPTFYASPSDAASAPAETHAYVVALNTGTNGDSAPDALTVLDLEAGSPTYGQLVGRLDMPNVGDELHHFGWNACSSALCPWAAHPHVERRYLLVPGLRSSRIHVVDVKDDPHNPTLTKVIEPEEIATQDRLLAAAHDPLRPRRDLRLRARQPRGRRPGRHLPARPRELLGQGRLGAGPRPAGAGLRLLVAPQPGHGHHLRVGHAEHGRERAAARPAAEQPVRPQAPHLGPREAHARPGDRPRRRAPDGARAAAGARPAQGLRLRRRGRLDRRPDRLDLAVGAQRRTARSRPRR